MVWEEVVLGDAKFEIENVQELAFNSANVAFAEYTGAQGPVDVL